MGGSCKGKCEYDDNFFVSQKGGYQNGFKRCTSCEKFTSHTCTHCPCCGRMFRIQSKTPNLRMRKKLIQQGEITQEQNRKMIVSHTDGTYEVVDVLTQ